MNLHEEINRQKTLMGVTENPHRIKAREFGEMTFESKDAVAFEYRRGKVYLEPKGTHGGGVTAFYKYTVRQKDVPKWEESSIHGRIWTVSRIVSFWIYPRNQAELTKVINDIYAEADVVRKVYDLPTFSIDYVEIPWNTVMDEPEPDWDTKSFAGSTNFKIIGVGDYDKYRKK
jgi:hypothetical protein